MITLGIDTSNYATSLAVYSTDAEEVVCDKKQFLNIKDGARGLRQSDAVFLHTKALPIMLEEIAKDFDISKIEAIGVSEKPRPCEVSYMPCFLAGVSVAKAFALAKNIPLIKTTHQQGHIAAATFSHKNSTVFDKDFFAFHISGGTTELLRVRGTQVLDTAGKTKDLYAGQAVDRIGVKLGFDFPAGEKISELAQNCEENIIPKVSVTGTDCSLSGLENKCCDLILKGAAQEYIAKFCLSYIAYTVIKIICNAKKIYGELPVICAGGVMSSVIIRDIVTQNIENIYFAQPKLSSDNAIGVAIIAAQEAKNG